MKQGIADIPVFEAFENEKSECPICAIEHRMESDFIDLLLLEFVNDDDFYIKLGKDYSFCREHFEKFYNYADKLGLAIIIDKILLYELDCMKKIDFNSIEKNKQGNVFKNLLSKPQNEYNFETRYYGECDCHICNKMKEDTERIIEVMLNLWRDDEKFRELYANSKGLCLKHFYKSIEKSDEMRGSKKEKDEFKKITLKIEKENLSRIQEEVRWFIKKFDYRYTNEPWKNSKDSVERSLTKLVGNYNKYK